MKKTILYIGGFILPDGNAAAHRVLNNAKILKALDYDVYFLGKSKQCNESNILETRKIIEDFITYKECYPSGIIQWLRHLISTKNTLAIINEIGKSKTKAIIAYNYPAIAFYRLKSYCHKNKIKVISDCTEWSIDPYKSPIRAIIKNIDTYLRMVIVHPKLDGLIAISSYLYKYYSKRMQNVIHVPPLINSDDKKWAFPITDGNKEIKLVYAGSPGTLGSGLKDRLDIIINSLSSAKSLIKQNFSLIIVGLTKQEYCSNFEVEEVPENIIDNVHFLGRLSHSETIRVLKEADFSIFLRDNNLVTKAGFPTKFVESITCGTPVITNSSSNIKHYMEDNKFGFIVDSNSESNLADSLVDILNLDKNKIKEMKRICFDSKIFDYQNYTLIFKSFFEGILKNKVL